MELDQNLLCLHHFHMDNGASLAKIARHLSDSTAAQIICVFAFDARYTKVALSQIFRLQFSNTLILSISW